MKYNNLLGTIRRKIDHVQIIWAVICYPHRKVGKLNIVGPLEFFEQTCNALKLLQEKCPDAFKKIELYLETILFYKRSGIFSTLSKPLCMVSKKSAYHSLVWYASGLAHESYHVYLYRTKANDMSDQEEERLCLEYEATILIRLGADESMIAYIKKAGEKRHWEVPPWKQDW